MWLLFTDPLWPQLLSNYRGYSPAQAEVISALGMLASFAVCGLSLIGFYHLLAAPAPLAAAATTPPSPVTRRRFVAVGLGALAAVVLWRGASPTL